jgi:hypothetical protein
MAHEIAAFFKTAATITLEEIRHAWTDRPLGSQFASRRHGYVDGSRHRLGPLTELL